MTTPITYLLLCWAFLSQLFLSAVHPESQPKLGVGFAPPELRAESPSQDLFAPRLSCSAA